jgi:hypothetical protein
MFFELSDFASAMMLTRAGIEKGGPTIYFGGAVTTPDETDWAHPRRFRIRQAPSGAAAVRRRVRASQRILPHRAAVRIGVRRAATLERNDHVVD